MLGIESSSGEIVDAQATITDGPVQLVNADLTTVLLFEGTARDKPAVVDRKDKGLEELGVASVEGNVQEDLIGVAGHRLP